MGPSVVEGLKNVFCADLIRDVPQKSQNRKILPTQKYIDVRYNTFWSKQPIQQVKVMTECRKKCKKECRKKCKKECRKEERNYFFCQNKTEKGGGGGKEDYKIGYIMGSKLTTKCRI